MKKKIFIACDTTDLNFIRKIIKNTKTNELEISYKFGLELFYSKKGRNFISTLKNKNLFLDLKFNDIPQTVVAGIKSLGDLKNVKYLTVHTSGGQQMMKTAKKLARKINKNIKLIGVTVLTSFSESSIKEVGYKKSIKSIVIQQALLAKKSGLSGIVCSGHEVKMIKKICKHMEIITPGIRLTGDGYQDQKRVMTPKDAFRNGATAIVIGRSITKGNIKKNINKLIESLK